MQCDPYYCQEELSPAEEVLDRQTDHQLNRNYAQTTHNVYELSDLLAAELARAGCGSGLAITDDWVPAKTVLINGEIVLYIKFKGNHVKMMLPCKSLN